MNIENFNHFCKLVQDRSGLVLTMDKLYLVEGRLLPIATAEGFASIDALLTNLRTPGVPESRIRRCVEAMATHETSFFRNRATFDSLGDVIIPSLLKPEAKRQSLSIWSAACSTGQEPYSIAMTIQQKRAELGSRNVHIVATDLIEETLNQARAGCFSRFEIQRGLTEKEIATYFMRKNEETWEVIPQLKTMIRYQIVNLLADFKHLGTFDIIFCRNVLIYFNRETKAKILNQMATMLAPDGFLVLGSAETVVGISKAFNIVREARGLYQPVQIAVGATG